MYLTLYSAACGSLLLVYLLGCAGSSWLHACGLPLAVGSGAPLAVGSGAPLAVGSGAPLRCGVQASPLQWLLLLGAHAPGQAGAAVVHTALAALRPVALPRPGIRPVFPILAGGVLSTVPPGKSKTALLFKYSKAVFL